MERIKLNDSLMDIVMKMSEGNPGAISIIMALVQKTPEIDKLDWAGAFGSLLSLDTLNIYGSNIWILFKDHCKQNIVHMIAVLRGWQLGFVTREDLRDGNFNCEEVTTKVVERLGAENFIIPEHV